jgi:hypothetical protein
LRFSSARPWAFTEHGAIMAATILKSARAVEMSVFVVRAFIRLRELARTCQAAFSSISNIVRQRLSDGSPSLRLSAGDSF